MALIQKRRSGLLEEAFLDSDKFRIVYENPNLSNEQKLVILGAAFFVDIQDFERKAK